MKTRTQVIAELKERAANVLGWKVEDTGAFSFPTLRELIREKDAALAAEMSTAIQQGLHLLGEPEAIDESGDDDYAWERDELHVQQMEDD